MITGKSEITLNSILKNDLNALLFEAVADTPDSFDIVCFGVALFEFFTQLTDMHVEGVVVGGVFVVPDGVVYHTLGAGAVMVFDKQLQEQELML